MPVRKSFRAEMRHLKADKGMPQRQALAVTLKYQRQGKVSRRESPRASRRTSTR